MPVIGSSKLDRITRAAQAMRLALTREHWYELYVAAMGSRLP
jgi:predicted oxidoreductase